MLKNAPRRDIEEGYRTMIELIRIMIQIVLCILVSVFMYGAHGIVPITYHILLGETLMYYVI